MNGWARAAALAVAVGAVACVEVGPRTGIDGQVRQRPCGRPIVEGEPICEDLPVEAGIVVTDSAGVERARTRTDGQGRFRVGLGAPGRYTVTVDSGTPTPRWPDCPVATVVVGENGVTKMDTIFCGSGMR